MKAYLPITIISFASCLVGGKEQKGSTFLIRQFCSFTHLSSQGMLALVLNCIDRLNIYNSVAHFAGIAREESGMAWKEILNLLYKLLGKYAYNPLTGKVPKGGFYAIST